MQPNKAKSSLFYVITKIPLFGLMWQNVCTLHFIYKKIREPMITYSKNLTWLDQQRNNVSNGGLLYATWVSYLKVATLRKLPQKKPKKPKHNKYKYSNGQVRWTGIRRQARASACTHRIFKAEKNPCPYTNSLPPTVIFHRHFPTVT